MSIMSTMSTKLKVVVLALGLGAAAVAGAQSPGQAQTFANEIQQWQALSGTGTYTFHTPPTLGNTAQACTDHGVVNCFSSDGIRIAASSASLKDAMAS